MRHDLRSTYSIVKSEDPDVAYVVMQHLHQEYEEGKVPETFARRFISFVVCGGTEEQANIVLQVLMHDRPDGLVLDDMTYEEFVEHMKSSERKYDPTGSDMKSVFRWASLYHFDHLWRYLTE